MAMAGQMSSDVPKPSFAKVAASTSRENRPPVPSAPRVIATEMAAVGKMQPSLVKSPVIANGRIQKPPPRPTTNFAETDAVRSSIAVDALVAVDIGAIANGVNNLNVDPSAPSVIVNGTIERLKELDRDGSDDLPRADSSSELGTKTSSLDGKSMTSGTTFGLDEKESLRPDDSASVKAAAEDDDAFSVRGSLLAGSRIGSDIAARARGIQLGDMPIADTAPSMLPTPGLVMLPPDLSSEQQRVTTIMAPQNDTTANQRPIEPLLNAMQKPKDRPYVLWIEKELREFVQNSEEPFVDIGRDQKSNAFYRMLAYKLADYFEMPHTYDQVGDTVRVYRTLSCNIPPPLISVEAAVVGNTPPPTVLPRKIMRRGGDVESVAFQSANASKAASDIDFKTEEDDEQVPPAKAQLSQLELSQLERKKRYDEARERIFSARDGNGGEDESNMESGVSRASSVSAKDRDKPSNRSKAKYRQPYNKDSPYDYERLPRLGTQQQMGPVGMGSYPGLMQNHQYVQPASPYMQNLPGQAPPPVQYATQYPFQPGPPQGMQQTMPPTMLHNMSHPMTSGRSQDQPMFVPGGSPVPAYGGAHKQLQTLQYPVPFFPHPYRPPFQQGPGNSNGIPPYQFGQLPNAKDPNSQHPIPGSYSRRSFNHNGQPSGPGAAGPPQLFTMLGPHGGSPQPQASPQLYPGPFPQPPPYSGPHVNNGGFGYGMMRQGSTSSLPPSSTQPSLVSSLPRPLPQGQQQSMLGPPHQSQSPRLPSKPDFLPIGPQFSAQYNLAAGLPPRPATGV